MSPRACTIAFPEPIGGQKAEQSGLLAVDALVCDKDARGVLALRTPSAAVAEAVERHIVRRAFVTQRTVVRVSGTADSCWRDACSRLGVTRIPADPQAAAKTLCHAAQDAIVVVLGDINPGSWDQAVLQALETSLFQALIVVVRWGDQQERFEQDKELRIRGAKEDFEPWWNGVVQDALARDEGRTLADLDRWWTWSSRHMDSVPEPDFQSLSTQALELLTSLRLTGRAWSFRSREQLGPSFAWKELEDLGLIVHHAGFTHLSSLSASLPTEPTSQQLCRVADILRTKFHEEPWALSRAGFLYMRAGQREHAQTCLGQALVELDDVLARHEVWDGWTQALAHVQGPQRRLGALFAAELALERDDVDASLELAHLAGGGDEAAPFQAHYVLGRAQLARGDMVGARGSLERAFTRSTTENDQAAALAQLAEVAYVVGDLEDAQRKATQATTQANKPTVRLDASNTLGKILLAQAQWAQAEAHFASDEHQAAAFGLELAQLRARVNRAIALLSKGQSEAARSILESVLTDAQRRHDQRAVAFALSNLAVLAIERHDHAQALSLSESAIDARRKLGDKVGLSRVVTNLAELRLQLGLVAEAEQTLAFGRQSLRTWMPPTRAAHFALVTARIRLAQTDTFEASREVLTALSMADGSSDGAMVGECYRVEARIALEDGDVERARRALREAEARADEPSAHAEVEFLQAKLAQALGQDALSLAQNALLLTNKSNDQDLLLEVHVLLAELRRIEGSTNKAKRHIDAAKQVRDRVVDSLPSSVRPRYLARRCLLRLAAIDEALRFNQAGSGDSAVDVSDDSAREAVSRKSASSGSKTGFVGRHASVTKLLGMVKKVARSSSPVLIIGESGTGKELIAEALHHQSDRHGGPLIKVNCAALADTLLLSELFGHEKGAFTGALSRRRGRFELADGGTLFLDEIGDISPATQVALLRVLQDRSFERVGGGMTLRTDVRVVCATHRDIRKMVLEGTFREDLYYRLSGVTLKVPSLRERSSDIVVIAKYLLDEIGRQRSEEPKKLTSDAIDILARHRWPGNVRELDNVLRAASLFSETEELCPDAIRDHILDRTDLQSVPVDRPSVVKDLPVGEQANSDTLRLAYDEIRTQGTTLSDLKRNIERECIRQALTESNGNITRAADLLGMKRPRLSQLVKQYGLLDGSWEDVS